MLSDYILVAGGTDKTIDIHSPSSTKKFDTRLLEPTATQANCIVISDDLMHIIVGGYRVIYVFQIVHHSRPILLLSHHDDNVVSIILINNNFLLGGSEDKSVSRYLLH
jgi:WD40 repeat protein